MIQSTVSRFKLLNIWVAERVVRGPEGVGTYCYGNLELVGHPGVGKMDIACNRTGA